jgi:hypothetical protein
MGKKTDRTMFEKFEQSSFIKRPHEIRVKRTPRYTGIFLLSDNLMKARRKCRCSGSGEYFFRFRKIGTKYLPGVQRRKTYEKGLFTSLREFKK